MKKAIILCNNDFGTEDAKTANDLIRFSKKYTILGIIDAKNAGQDAGQILDNKANGIPIFASVKEAYIKLESNPTHLIIGTLPVTAELDNSIIEPVEFAIRKGLTIINGLHTFLTENEKFVKLAKKYGVALDDVRKYHKRFRTFSGLIYKRNAFIISSVGTDANIGKMTTCLKIVESLNIRGIKAVFIATGQTGSMTGADYFKPIDSIPGPYESGELESLITKADKLSRPEIILVEGQGCMSYPPYGTLNFKHEAQLMGESNVLESALLEGAKPDALIITHAPKRKTLSGFTQYKIPNLFKEIHLNEAVGGAPVIAITINHENMTKDEVLTYCKNLSQQTGLPVEDVLYSTSETINHIIQLFNNIRKNHETN